MTSFQLDRLVGAGCLVVAVLVAVGWWVYEIRHASDGDLAWKERKEGK